MPAVMIANTAAPSFIGSAAADWSSTVPQADTGADPEDRARAVQDLRQAPAGDSVPELLRVLAGDRDRRNRITALQQLAQLGASRKVPGIEQALRGYSGDADPVVAAQAREASDALAALGGG